MDTEKLLTLLSYLEQVKDLVERVERLEEEVGSIKRELSKQEVEPKTLASQIAAELVEALMRRHEDREEGKKHFSLEDAAELAIHHYKLMPPRRGD